MMSVPLYRVDRTIQNPHSALNRSLTSSGSKLDGRPTLIVLGGSARTLGNMNRPIIAVNAAVPAVNAPHPRAAQLTNSGPAKKPRRLVPGPRAAAGVPAVSLAPAVAALDGLGRTLWGFASFSRPAALAAVAALAG